MIAHAGALDGEPGVVLIAGTGVVALAIGADGALRTADGWGPWLGDEGGGAWIGAAGLRTALRAHDGRGRSTTLLDAARARFGAGDLARAAHRGGHGGMMRLPTRFTPLAYPAGGPPIREVRYVQ